MRTSSAAPLVHGEEEAAKEAGGGAAPLGGESFPLFASVLKGALVAAGVIGITGWLFLASFHLDDRYKVGHVPGHWMALARYANEGTLYPPLSDGARFGGTRHMPLPILVNAGAGRVTGEYLRSGKTVAILLFAALLTLVVAALRQLRCPWPLTLGLTGLLPATGTGLLAGSAPGGDVLVVVLQLGAILVMTASLRRDTVGLFVAAGGLAGLAVCSKLTGIWPALTVFGWCALRQDWRRLAWFAAACGVSAGVVIGLVQWASDGRFLTTFLTLTFAGTGGPVGAIRAPNQLIMFASRYASAVWMVAPFAVLGAIAAWRLSALNLYHHALGWSLLLTLVVFTDMGAGLNQLLEPAVLTLLIVGDLAARLPWNRLGGVTLVTVLPLAVIWAGCTGVRGFVPDVREAMASVRLGRIPEAYNPRPLAALVARQHTLLAEDPGLPVLLGQTPIVLDAFMLRRLDQVQPASVDALVRRIQRGEFDYVATINALDGDEFWWEYYHFGLRVVGALKERYAFFGFVDGYYVYRPRRP